MKIETRIRQSEAAARSGTRLVLFLAVCSAGAFLLEGRLLAKISGVLALVFTAVTIVEYWNAWRLGRRTRKSAV
jgi:hypothetical protein